MKIGQKVFYNEKLYIIVSAETDDRWWIRRPKEDEPILVDEKEIKINRITKQLEKLLARANKKLAEAQDARMDVMDYIEMHYGINADDYYQIMEDECTWCYGIDIDAMQRLIETGEDDD